MKLKLLEIIFCPNCHNKLKLENYIKKNNEIFKGSLKCTKCNSIFPIHNYIPRLIKGYNYSKSWGFLWKKTGAIARDSFTRSSFHYNIIHGKYNEEGKAINGTSPFGFNWPANLKGKNILEIGPGTGNCTEHLVNTNAEVVSIDMSDSIDTFPEELLIRSNLHIIQADINSSIIKINYFDRIWFFQVLQHTPSPPDTLKFIYKLLKKGGYLSVTSYLGKFNPWYYPITKKIDGQLMWRLLCILCPILVPIKYKLLRVFNIIKIKFLNSLFSLLFAPIDPRNIYFNTLEGKFNDYLIGQKWNETHNKKLLMKYVILNTFDRITPNYTNCVKDHETMKKWLMQAGFSSCKIWGKSGVRAEAIK